MKLPVLPVYYYLDHFEEMLAFVGKTYGAILNAAHHGFIAKFKGCPMSFDPNAQPAWSDLQPGAMW